LVVAWPAAAWAAAEALVVRPGAAAAAGPADALVVLAGSADYRGRARRAAELYAEGRAGLVLLTDDGQRGGWSAAEQRNPLFVERAAEELRRGGVPDARVVRLEGVVGSTYEEAARAREFAASARLRSVVVVAGAYQSRRALWTFRRVFGGSGVRVGVEPAPTGGETPGPALWWLRPRGWRLVPTEYFKLAYYRLNY
jgi:uncharacterized SAM-binding protein YcdF (DUF218 family)